MKTLILTVLMSSLLATPALALDPYFANIDKNVSPKASQERLISERYLMMMARLSVFSLFCDPDNTRTYSQLFSSLWNKTTQMQTRAEVNMGGMKAVYNRLEKYRNIESNRIAFVMGPAGCNNAFADYVIFIEMDPTKFVQMIQTTKRGQM